MGQFKVNHRYTATRDGRRLGPFEPEMVVELDDDDAAFITVDSPGALSPARGPEEKPEPDQDVESERAAQPARNRQQKPGRNRAAG